MDIELFDSERKVMDVLWQEGKQSAGQLAKILKEETGWNRNTTLYSNYDKEAIHHLKPGFICLPLIDTGFFNIYFLLTLYPKQQYPQLLLL